MDFSYLNSISEGDMTFISQFMSTFKESTNKLIAGMHEKYQDKDYASLKHLGHQIKPSLEMMRLSSYELAVKIQNNPELATIDDIKNIELECLMAVKGIKEKFNLE